MTLNLAKTELQQKMICVESPMTRLIELSAPVIAFLIFKLATMMQDLLLTCRFRLV